MYKVSVTFACVIGCIVSKASNMMALPEKAQRRALQYGRNLKSSCVHSCVKYGPALPAVPRGHVRHRRIQLP